MSGPNAFLRSCSVASGCSRRCSSRAFAVLPVIDRLRPQRRNVASETFPFATAEQAFPLYFQRHQTLPQPPGTKRFRVRRPTLSVHADPLTNQRTSVASSREGNRKATSDNFQASVRELLQPWILLVKCAAEVLVVDAFLFW